MAEGAKYVEKQGMERCFGHSLGARKCCFSEKFGGKGLRSHLWDLLCTELPSSWA